MPLGAVRGFFSFLAALGFGVVVEPSSFLGRPRPFLVGSTSVPAGFSALSAVAFFAAGAFFLDAAAVGAAPPTFFGRPRPTLAFLGGSSSASSSAARFSPVFFASGSSAGSSSSLPLRSAGAAVLTSSMSSGTSAAVLAASISCDTEEKTRLN